MLLDANLLLYAVHEGAEQHEPVAIWLTEQLNGASRVGFPWQSINAFLRISTHPRGFSRPHDLDTAWERVTDWLAAPVAWLPQPGHEHHRIFGELIQTHQVRGNLIPDAALAALAIEHGVALASDGYRLRALSRAHVGEPAELRADVVPEGRFGRVRSATGAGRRAPHGPLRQRPCSVRTKRNRMRVSKLPSSPHEDVRELMTRWSAPLMILLTRTVRRPEIAYDIAAEALARARQEWSPGDAPSLVGDATENRTDAGVAWLVGIAAAVLREAAETGVVPSVERRRGGAAQIRRLSRAHQQELIALTEHATELPDTARAAAAALARDAPQPRTLARLRLSDLVDAELVVEELHGQPDR